MKQAELTLLAKNILMLGDIHQPVSIQNSQNLFPLVEDYQRLDLSSSTGLVAGPGTIMVVIRCTGEYSLCG